MGSVFTVPEVDDEKPEENMVEDMSDIIAQEKVKEEARLRAFWKNRSKVLQGDLPRPLIGFVDRIRYSLIKADEDNSSFVPPTLIQQADEIIRKELLYLNMITHNILLMRSWKRRKRKETSVGNLPRISNNRSSRSTPRLNAQELNAQEFKFQNPLLHRKEMQVYTSNSQMGSVFTVPEVDDEEPDENMVEDMSNIIAQEKVKEEARLRAFRKNRSKVLQGDLPRPLIGFERAFVLEHDNAKYPLDEKLERRKRKETSVGNLPSGLIVELQNCNMYRLAMANVTKLKRLKTVDLRKSRILMGMVTDIHNKIVDKIDFAARQREM
ncbi:cell division cycle 5-like protein [Tanacetum coccineum]